ncbi:MFS transporter [Lentzea sp. NPDC051213]|uniref:MFS transporter n=1 Tax=Lentzea sp. NPDC051213 TaxID=3364126 RepID=UPI00379FF263
MTTETGRQAVSLRGNKDFLLLWSGAGISFLGSRVSTFAYPLIVLWATGSAPLAGLVAFAAQLPYVVVQLPAGIVVDRFDRRRLMVVCDLGRVLAVGSIPVVVLFGGFGLWHLAVVAFVEGSLTVVYRIAERAALRSVVDEDQLNLASSRNEARERASGMLGQPVAGVLAGLAQWAPFLFTSVAHVFSLGTVLLIKKKLQAPRATGRRRVFAELAEGVRWLWRQKFARACAGLIAVSNLLFQVMFLALLVIVRQDGGSEVAAAVIFTVSGVCGVFGALNATWWIRRIALPRLVIGANLAWALLVPFIAFTHNAVALGFLYGATSYVGAVWTVAVGAHLVRIVPDELLGRVTSVVSLLSYGPLAFGSLLGGFALESLGVTTTVLAIGGLMLLLTGAATASPSVRSPAG